MTAPAPTPPLLDVSADAAQARFDDAANHAVLDSSVVTVHLPGHIAADVGPIRLEYRGRGTWRADTGATAIGVAAIRIDGTEVDRATARYGMLVDDVLDALRDAPDPLGGIERELTARRAEHLDAMARRAERAYLDALREKLR